jgi:hypothetical protein
MMNWIRVDERMPEKHREMNISQDVLVCTSDEWVGVAFYDDQSGEWRVSETSDYVDGVTHWMPLPAPPEAQP